ncbi:hypothetical protein [Candidatus Villigracilis saccharophilus]|uniref:hypothetical protein n=1 Tax=Candidatus Villigracilis saccharophilus TaxID=3140684 RepID=UPI0031360FCC|nr:hypothetical protein [Anaerolineales bacterium]
MQLDAILEVAIGLILTWLILSMATSQIQEAIIESLGWRSTFLERRLQEMFHDPALVAQFYKHPLIESLSARTFWGRKRKPKGIPNDIFARAAVDVFLNAGKVGNDIPAGTMSLEVMKQSVVDSFKYLDNSNQVLSRTVKYLVPKLNQETTDVENTLVKYRENVETWFDTTMSQATLLYRKHASLIALVLGITLASGFNVDSLVIVNHLWRDPTLRQAIVAQAENINPEESFSVTGIQDQLNELSLPVGWNNETTPQGFADWLLKFLGIILSGLAASLGAPFWFDILNKLLGLKPNKTEKG